MVWLQSAHGRGLRDSVRRCLVFGRSFRLRCCPFDCPAQMRDRESWRRRARRGQSTGAIPHFTNLGIAEQPFENPLVIAPDGTPLRRAVFHAYPAVFADLAMRVGLLARSLITNGRETFSTSAAWTVVSPALSGIDRTPWPAALATRTCMSRSTTPAGRSTGRSCAPSAWLQGPVPAVSAQGLASASCDRSVPRRGRDMPKNRRVHAGLLLRRDTAEPRSLDATIEAIEATVTNGCALTRGSERRSGSFGSR